jgi:adenosylhomocysteine nucleosidase
MSRIAIVSAMAEELQGLQDHLANARSQRRAGRQFWLGRLGEIDVVLVLSGIGKVAAATTATILTTEFQVDRIVFTGAAGGLGAGVEVGDIVVAEHLVQHDMDASPLFPRYQVPLYGISRFPVDAALSMQVRAAAQAVLAKIDGAGTTPSPAGVLKREQLAEFGIAHPRVHSGLILSGDRFVSGADESRALRAAFPEALAVEMEGAAVAQICHDFGLPFAVLRTVSDRANDSAHVDFGRFIADIASRYTVAVVLELITDLRD